MLGKPIAHSLSPVIHNAGYAAAGLTGWPYTRIECAERRSCRIWSPAWARSGPGCR